MKVEANLLGVNYDIFIDHGQISSDFGTFNSFKEFDITSTDPSMDSISLTVQSQSDNNYSKVFKIENKLLCSDFENFQE